MDKSVTQEGSTGDTVVILDRRSEGYDLKSVTIKNCVFDVKSTVEVDGETVAVGYAVRYLDKNNNANAAITPVLEGDTDVNGNAIAEGDIGMVYSYYSLAE